MKHTKFVVLALVASAWGCARRELPGQPAPPERSPCQFDSPLNAQRPVLAWYSNNSLSLLLADGEKRAAFTYAQGSGTAPLFVAPFASGLAVRDGFIAAAAQVQYPQPRGAEFEAVLLDQDGQVKWHITRPMQQSEFDNGGIWLGGQGLVMLSIPPHRNIVVLPDGSEQSIIQGQPVAEPSADGWIPLAVGHLADSSTQFQWVSSSGAVQPGAHAIGSASLVSWIADRLFYSTSEGNQSLVVSERPGDAKTFPGEQWGSLVEVRNEWAMFQNGAASWARFNAKTGELAQFHPVADKQLGIPHLDNDGSVSIGLFDTQTAALFAMRDFGKSFERIGQEISRGADMFILSTEVSGGTYLISNETQLFVHQAPLVTQLVRPSDNVQRDVSTLGQRALSSDGLCLASMTASNTPSESMLQVFDVRSGKLLELKNQADVSPSAPVWIN